MKLLSLLKAVLTQDMNLFKYNAGKNSSKIKKLLLPLLLFIIVSISIGGMIYTLSEDLAKYHLTFVVLSLVLTFISLMTFIEGVNKSQSILFDCKDNDLLFSLPIKKNTIIFIRIIKLLLFEYIFNLMFLLPTFITYIIFEHPSIDFYLLSLLMMILIPIIPTILSCFIGYLIKLISSKMKSKNIIQTLLTSIFFMGIFLISLNSEELMSNIIKNATSINDIIIKIYYPVGAYISLLNRFDIIVFIKLLLINIIPFIIFIMIGQKYYFKIISNSKNNKIHNKIEKKLKIKQNKPIISLIKKELKTYTKSPVFMFNTSFGLIIALVFTIILCLKGKSSVISLLSTYGISKNISTDILFYGILLFSLCSTSITSSSISLESKTINITKTFPIDYKIILKSKILMCFVIELPFVLLSSILFIVFYQVSFILIIQILLLIITTILLNAVIGLLFNLKYPKLDCNNDIEVVKQSMSSMISVLTGFGIFIISIIGIILCNKLFNNMTIVISIHLLIFIICDIILYRILMNYGPKKYQELSV